MKLNKDNQNLTHYNDQYSYEIEYKYKTNTRYQRDLIKLLEKEMNYIPKSVLDVGCGQGLNTVRFANDWPNAEITGVDLSDIGIEYAKNHYQANNISFYCMDVSDMLFEGKKFDLVTAFELLEHIEDWQKVANVMTEISNRYIMVSAPIGRMRAYEKEHGHFRNYQKGELESFFEKKGFKTVKTYYAGFPFWSPITRNLLNLLPMDNTSDVQVEMGLPKKIISLSLYYSYKYFSFKNKGDQFVGLFEKIKEPNSND